MTNVVPSYLYLTMLGKKLCAVFPFEEQVCFLGLLQVGFVPRTMFIRIPSSQSIWDLGSLCIVVSGETHTEGHKS